MIVDPDFNMTDDTILTLHPDPSKQGVRISREKYEVVRAAILRLLRVHGSQTFTSLGNLVEETLQPNFDGSVMWYYTTIKLDMEARGELRRVPKSSPQKIELIN